MDGVSLADRIPADYVERELGRDGAAVWFAGEPARPIVDGGFTVTFEKRGPDGSPMLLEVPKVLLCGGSS